MAAGRANAEIAASLCVAESTVRKHLENSYRKLGVSNRMAAVARLRGSDHDGVDLRGRIETFAATRMGTPAARWLDRNLHSSSLSEVAMMLTRRSLTLGTVAGAAAATLAPRGLLPEALAASGSSSESPQVVLDWERIVFRTVYTVAATPIPVGVPVLGFVSVAMHRAATRSAEVGASSERAAVATAAHDVLVHYYPAQSAPAGSRPGSQPLRESDRRARSKGARIGAKAAARMLASRVGDHYLDPSFHYAKAPGPGVWQPNPGSTDMLAPWLGSLRPLFVQRPVPVAGPYALTSAAYAEEFDEVRRLGRASSVERTAEQTATAQFFNSNSATMVGDALIRRLEVHPLEPAGHDPAVRDDPRRHDRLRDPGLGTQARRGLLASQPGDRGCRHRRQPRHRPRGRTGLRSCPTRTTPTTSAVTPA